MSVPVSGLELPERSAAFFWVGRSGEAMLGNLGARVSTHRALAPRRFQRDPRRRPSRLRPTASGGSDASLLFRRPNERAERHRLDARRRLYFRDPDGHLLEYLAMLDARPRPDLGIVTWSQWKGAHLG